jgi:hypothetical protein
MTDPAATHNSHSRAGGNPVGQFFQRFVVEIFCALMGALLALTAVRYMQMPDTFWNFSATDFFAAAFTGGLVLMAWFGYGEWKEQIRVGYKIRALHNMREQITFRHHIAMDLLIAIEHKNFEDIEKYLSLLKETKKSVHASVIGLVSCGLSYAKIKNIPNYGLYALRSLEESAEEISKERTSYMANLDKRQLTDKLACEFEKATKELARLIDSCLK